MATWASEPCDVCPFQVDSAGSIGLAARQHGPVSPAMFTLSGLAAWASSGRQHASMCQRTLRRSPSPGRQHGRHWVGSAAAWASEPCNVHPLWVGSVGSDVSAVQQRGPASPATFALSGSAARVASGQQCGSAGCIGSAAWQRGLHWVSSMAAQGSLACAAALLTQRCLHCRAPFRKGLRHYCSSA